MSSDPVCLGWISLALVVAMVLRVGIADRCRGGSRVNRHRAPTTPPPTMDMRQ